MYITLYVLTIVTTSIQLKLFKTISKYNPLTEHFFLSIQNLHQSSCEFKKKVIRNSRDVYKNVIKMITNDRKLDVKPTVSCMKYI